MKILQIQPAKAQKTIGREDVFIFEPPALEYLASGIKDVHEVKILDMRFDKDLDTEIKEYKPDVVGITAFTVHVNIVKNLFNKIKNIALALNGFSPSISRRSLMLYRSSATSEFLMTGSLSSNNYTK